MASVGDILRDEFWLDESKYTKIQRDNFISLIWNYRNEDIDMLEDEIADLKQDKKDIKDSIYDGIATLENIRSTDDVDKIMNSIQEAIKELRYWL